MSEIDHLMSSYREARRGADPLSALAAADALVAELSSRLDGPPPDVDGEVISVHYHGEGRPGNDTFHSPRRGVFGADKWGRRPR
jgi:hypothetical protein